MNYSVDIRRRNFIKTSLAIGGGLVLGFYVAPGAAEMSAVDNIPKNIEPNAWIRINNDDTVTVFVSKSEMGQGVYTSMPMLIAEELEIAWDKIRVEPAAAAPVYRHTQFGVQVTGGSSSVSSSWEQLRIVGATMREMLIHAAAKKMGHIS